jgi:hypothetical protein
MIKNLILFLSGVMSAALAAALYIWLLPATFLSRSAVDSYYSRFSEGALLGVLQTSGHGAFERNYLTVLTRTDSGIEARFLGLPESWSNDLLVVKNRASGSIRIGDIPSNVSYEIDLSALVLKRDPGLAVIGNDDDVLLLIRGEKR